MQTGYRPQVLVCDPIAQKGIDLLREYVDVDIKTNLPTHELLRTVPQYDGLITRSATQITEALLKHGLKLKIIGRAGVGLENVDVKAAQERGVVVVNSPDANSVAVAEHTMGLMLSLARHLPFADSSLKEGRWEKTRLVGTGLAGKTLGIVGFGRIGREVALRAQAFGMKILVNQKRHTPETLLENVDSVDLYELLRQSDFVTLHVPYRAETAHLIGAAELALLKPTAYLINTARGGVVDEAALLDALNNGRIAGAALDVFSEEPATQSALAQHPAVIATPHIGASTSDAQEAAAVSIAQQFIEFFQDVQVESVLPLRVVPMADVVPHEHIDQKRVDRLAKRLAQDNRLSNPPIVMETEDGRYMVLDGATRSAALKQLGFPHAVVQIASLDEGLGLHTWYHVIEGLSPETLLHMLRELPDIELAETAPDHADEALFEYGGLCYFHFVDGRVFMVYATQGVNRMDALNRLTAAYIDAGHVDRTLNKNLISLKSHYPDMGAVVIFPEYTVNQVVQVSLASGRYFPAGITRFIIPGRILRVNADLTVLKSDQSLREKNRWLHKLLLEKQRKGGIRYYAEPVYLLDE